VPSNATPACEVLSEALTESTARTRRRYLPSRAFVCVCVCVCVFHRAVRAKTHPHRLALHTHELHAFNKKRMGGHTTWITPNHAALPIQEKCALNRWEIAGPTHSAGSLPFAASIAWTTRGFFWPAAGGGSDAASDANPGSRATRTGTGVLGGRSFRTDWTSRYLREQCECVCVCVS
jgi:hypothetical protein